MSVRIGISPISWQNDDLPDLTAGFTMEQALKEAREIGYVGVERGQRMPQDTEGLKGYLNTYDLALCGGWCSGNLLVNSVTEEIAAIGQQVEQFIALQAPCLVYAECSNTIQGDRTTPVNNRPKLSRDDIKAYAAKLSELAAWMADQGMVLAYHHHMGSIIESQDDVDTLMAASDPAVKLCFDTGHMHFGGGDVLGTLKAWGGRIHHVHFKDVRADIVTRARADDLSFLDAVIAGAFTVPGDAEGCIDFKAVIDELASLNFTGWLVVEAEQDPAKAPPYLYAKRGYDYIVEACRQSGLAIAA